MAATAGYVQKLGAAVKKVAGKRGSSWYTPHMAAATRAIMERIPLVDLVVEVRDARVPLSSEYELLRNFPHSLRHIILLNKMDLASRPQLKVWRAYFEQQNLISYEVNAHNKEHVKEFLNFLQARVRELTRTDHANHTITVMLLGIPNVGKSALANALHQIGRISAAEKGKLKHATVSPLPGETKDISSLKIGSHPNIYVLDTPGVLPPMIPDAEVYSKLALTGAINDCLIGESELAQYFLAIHNLSDEYKKWAKLSMNHSEKITVDGMETSSDSELDKRRKQYATDHTQDFVVHDVRRTLFETVSSFPGNPEAGKDLVELIEAQFSELQKAFKVLVDTQARTKVAAKLLNLYRTGRLGHYTLDSIPRNS
ncbi:DAR GTPase 2, mitochondrial-like isoform X1 [Rhododendron vialii]|uniref:DAR GTPase 2, mitochondrial-like isoform X1 n=1 Tax=Rhododendron vialii TaxID=182163 RepID=UPI00265FA587|nr:DAR GTPase 2, mitochondrial-like isoform X1 [Rhododendron vialii]